MNPVPPLDFERYPLARHWDQPDPTNFLWIGDSVLLTLREMCLLRSYDSTFPSGVYPGKCWKRNDRKLGPVLVWFGHGEEPGSCSINYRKILERKPSRLVAQDFLAVIPS